MESHLNCYVVKLKPQNFERYDIISSTSLQSDVPCIYANKVGFDFMRPPVPKTASALAVAFISNCSPRNMRNVFIDQLRAAGVSVHSYGRCKHDGNLEEEVLICSLLLLLFFNKIRVLAKLVK